MSYRDRTILAVIPGRVSRLTVAREEGSYTLDSAGEPGTPPRWRMSAPSMVPPMTIGGERPGDARAPSCAERLVAEDIGDGKVFGLDAPGLSLTWATHPEEGEGRGGTNREPRTLRISLKGPTADTFYANVSGSPLVFTVGGPQLQPLLAEFREHRVLSFPAAKVCPWSFTGPVGRWPSTAKPDSGRTLHLGRLPGSEGIRFDLSRLDALVTALADLNVPRFTQYAGPFPESAGLNCQRLAIEVEATGEIEKRRAQGRRCQGRRCALHPVPPGARGRSSSSPTRDGATCSAPGTGVELPENVFAPYLALASSVDLPYNAP